MGVTLLDTNTQMQLSLCLFIFACAWRNCAQRVKNGFFVSTPVKRKMFVNFLVVIVEILYIVQKCIRNAYEARNFVRAYEMKNNFARVGCISNRRYCCCQCKIVQFSLNRDTKIIFSLQVWWKRNEQVDFIFSFATNSSLANSTFIITAIRVVYKSGRSISVRVVNYIRAISRRDYSTVSKNVSRESYYSVSTL